MELAWVKCRFLSCQAPTLNATTAYHDGFIYG